MLSCKDFGFKDCIRFSVPAIFVVTSLNIFPFKDFGFKEVSKNKVLFNMPISICSNTS